MSILRRIKPNNLFHHFKRHYFQIHAPRLSNQITTPTSNIIIPTTTTNAQIFRGVCRREEDVFNTRVRFFAAPAQFLVKKKEKVNELGRPRMNDEIKHDVIRLVTDTGHTVVSRKEALLQAKDLDLDLVEVDRHAKPPVCKIMDYKREQYKKQVIGKEKAKMKSAGSLRSGACKEVRFSTKAELKDLKIKADAVKKLMERGYRVKCMALAAEDQDLTGLLSQVIALIEDVALVECGPFFEKRQGYFIVRHIKFGPSKKGAGTKASLVKIDADLRKGSAACSDSSVGSEEQTVAGKSGMDNNGEESDIDSEDEVEEPLQGQVASSYDKQKRFDSSGTKRNDASAVAPQLSNAVNSNAAPSSQGLENRYARKVPNNASSVRSPTGFSNGRSHPQTHSQIRPREGYRQGGRDDSSPRNFSPRQNDNQPRVETPNRARHYDNNFSPQGGPPRPPSSANNHIPQPTGFGIFGGAKAESSPDVNRQTSASPPIVTRKVAVPGNINPPTPRTDGSPVENGKKWGIFSGDNSKSVSGKG